MVVNYAMVGYLHLLQIKFVADMIKPIIQLLIDASNAMVLLIDKELYAV
jgi:hypothetical protein